MNMITYRITPKEDDQGDFHYIEIYQGLEKTQSFSMNGKKPTQEEIQDHSGHPTARPMTIDDLRRIRSHEFERGKE